VSAAPTLVSVIVGAYNGARYIGETIESVLAQTYRPFELVVVDDASEDTTGDIARSFGPDVKVVTRTTRGGIGGARNSGLEAADGAYFTFLDADDRVPPEKLSLQTTAFEENPDVDIVFGHVTEFVSPDVSPDEAARLREPAHNVVWRTPNLMLVKRDSFYRVGPFSTEIKVGIGVDWIARASDLGLKMLDIPEVVLERRLHGDNNGIRERDSRTHYLRVLKASIDRRRAAEGEPRKDDAPPRS
jgi:glycosyltransferase involved in cell wall biosynthesis